MVAADLIRMAELMRQYIGAEYSPGRGTRWQVSGSLRPADQGFGAADAQCDVFGLGAGEHAGQGAQAQALSLRDGEPASAQQRPDLADHPAVCGEPDLAVTPRASRVNRCASEPGRPAVGRLTPTRIWPGAGLAPPVATAHWRRPDSQSRLPLRRESVTSSPRCSCDSRQKAS